MSSSFLACKRHSFLRCFSSSLRRSDSVRHGKRFRQEDEGGDNVVTMPGDETFAVPSTHLVLYGGFRSSTFCCSKSNDAQQDHDEGYPKKTLCFGGCFTVVTNSKSLDTRSFKRLALL